MMRRRQALEDLDQQVREHLERETQDNIERGLSPEEARRAALRKFGNIALAKEDARAVWTPVWCDHLVQDLRYAARVLLVSRTFALTTIVILGLSIGLCTAVFTQVQNTFFRPVSGISEPSALASVLPEVSFPVYESFSDSAGPFSVAAAYVMAVPFAWKEQPAYRPMGQVVTPNYFQVLGVGLQAGSGFGGRNAVPGTSPTIVVSDRFWRTRLQSDPTVIGRDLNLNGRMATIVGVASSDFYGAAPALGAVDLWVPTTASRDFVPEIESATFLDATQKLFVVVGRLRPGVTAQSAQTQLSALARQFENVSAGERPTGPAISLVSGARQLPIPDEAIKVIAPVVVVVPILLTTLMLWIVCANIGAMLIARSAARRREIAIRLALGASRSRVVRQFLTESVLLAVLGGAAGVLVATGFGGLSGVGPDDRIPSVTNVKLGLFAMLSNAVRYSPDDGRLHWGALLLAFALSLVCAFMFGLLPALQATRPNVAQSLTPGTPWQFVRARWFRLRNVLMLQQVAGSTALLLLTGFVALGMQRMAAVDLGFDTQDVYALSVDPIRNGYSVERTQDFFTTLPERLEGLGGVRNVALAYELPLTGGGGTSARAQAGDASLVIGTQRVGVGFFETIGIPIKRGRAFAALEREPSSQIVINETLALRAWPGQDPTGQEVVIEAHRYEVIGVAQDTTSGTFASVQPVAFHPLTRADFARVTPSGMLVVVRGTPGTNPMGRVEDELRKSDPNVAMFNATSLLDEVDRMSIVARRSVLMYSSIGVFGLIIATLGLAGITAFAVVQRTKEIAVRIALGATRSSILWLVTREGFVLLVIGTLLGEAIALALTRILGAQFFALSTVTRTSTSDPILVLGAPLLLGFVTMLVCVIPTRRSIHLNPVSALREE